MATRIKFKWRSDPNAEQSWLFGLIFEPPKVHGRRSRTLIIGMRRVCIAAVAAVIFGYFTGAALLFGWLDRRPYNFVTYTDLILPWHWREVSDLRGKAYIAEGLDDFRGGRWQSGMMKLRAGLGRHPEDAHARLELARFFIAANSRARAMDTLKAGMKYGYPGRGYMKLALQLAASGEDYDLCADLCDQGIAALDRDAKEARPDERDWLVQQKLIVLLQGDRAAEALELSGTVTRVDENLLNEIKIQALLQDHRNAEAVAFAEQWRTKVGDTAQVLRLQARAYREAGDIDKMVATLDRYRATAPADPVPLAYGVVQCLLAKRPDLAQTRFDDFIFRFGGTVENLLLLAGAVAQADNLQMVERCEHEAGQLGQPLERFKQIRINLLVDEGRWKEAHDLIGELPPVDAKTPLDLREWQRLTTLRLNALLDPADGVQANLTAYVRQRQFKLVLYRKLVEEFEKVGSLTTARDLAVFGLGVYPNSDYLTKSLNDLNQRISSDKAAKAAGDLESTRAAAMTEQEFLAKFDPLVAAGRLAEAAAMVRDLRRGSPAWMERYESRFRLLTLQLAVDGGDSLEIQGAARPYLNGDDDRSEKALGLARELKAAGKDGQAMLLLNEVLRKAPLYDPAIKLKKEWTPKKSADGEQAKPEGGPRIEPVTVPGAADGTAPAKP